MKISRRTLMKTGLAAAPAAAGQSPAAPPNIVFLLSDDHTWADLGCYGNTAVHTPNLDRMAREGMRFNHCYVSSPQCSPNRSSIFTGCTPHTTATSRLHTPMPEWEPSFLEPLKERGYFVGAFRKVHQGADFDRRWNFYGDRSTPFEKFFDAAPPKRPFWLQLGFTDPHRPYRDGAFSPPHDPKSVRVPPFLPDTAAVRQDLAHYYDGIARMDAECGRLFQILEQRGLKDNTLVVFSGDNGMPFPRAKGANYDPGIRVPLLAWWPGACAPERSRTNSSRMWTCRLRGWPPRAWRSRRRCRGAVSSTCCWGSRTRGGRRSFPSATGTITSTPSAPCARRATSSSSTPRRTSPTARPGIWPIRPRGRRFSSKARRGRLTPAQQKMLDPARPMLELYDLQKDPNEFNNVATDPVYAEALEDLKGRLSAWMHATYDFLPPAYAAEGEPQGRGWPATL